MHFYFIGVTTGQSAMVRILPLWSKALGLDLELVGIDLPLDASPLQYRDAVSNIKNDPKAIGSVVTTHKLKLFQHAGDLFDDFDEISKLTKEIGAITKRNSRLAGLAEVECLSNTLSLKAMLPTDYWRNQEKDVLCFGAGGVARAIALSLLFDFESDEPFSKPRLDKPRKLYLVDVDQQQLSSIRSLLEKFPTDLEIEYICQTRAEDNDRLVPKLPAGSLIINATGMGKDRPGSPLTDQARFPTNATIWDLNYRGELHFLKQAKSQEAEQGLHIHDGWLCFMYGWTNILQASLAEKFSTSQFQELTKIAEPFRVNRQ